MNLWKPFIQEFLSMFLFPQARPFFQQVTKKKFSLQRETEGQKDRGETDREVVRQRDSNKAFFQDIRKKWQRDRKTKRQ
jgi:hypothetical protein